jgi:hypothetical protein
LRGNETDQVKPTEVHYAWNGDVADAGDHALKGVPERWHLYSVVG